MGININNLANEITRALQQYTNEVQGEIEVASEEVATESVNKLKQTSPKRTGKYAKGWTKKKQGNGWVVHNRRGQITHLLEKGHVKRSGGRVAARVHIAPVEQKAIDDFLKRVEKAVKG